MNRTFFIFMLWSVVLWACHGTEKGTLSTSALMQSDSCRMDAQNKYEVYLSKRSRGDEKLPLLIILDAHGDGRFALKQFISAANQYHFLLAASDCVKNDVPNYLTLIETLLQDVQQKYPVNQEVFLTGFSGGARMALGFALTHRVDGLLMCGALANSEQLEALHVPVISISGTDDFNFMETAQYLFPIDGMPANLKIVLTHDMHQWPDSLLLSNEIGFLRFSNMPNDRLSFSKRAVLRYELKQEAWLDSLVRQGDFVSAVLTAHNMISTAPFDTIIFFSRAYRSLVANQAFQNDLNQLRQSLTDENNQRQHYLNAFDTQDETWWKGQIERLNQQIQTAKNRWTRDMYVRLKAFLGIACYSMAQQAVMAHDDVALSNILPIYRMLEPHNPDMLYFSAFIPYHKGDYAATVRFLKQALKAGYSDRKQLQRDFPALQDQWH
ncbi:MAG: hypothetical protein ACP5F6_07175 [Microbacter sp.]